MNVDRIRLHPYSLPLKYPLPLKGTVLTERQGIIVEIRSGDCFGYGDVAPLADFSRESLADVGRELDQLIKTPADISPGQLQEYSPSVVFGIESALWTLRQTSWHPAPACAPLLLGETTDILHRLKNWKESWPGEFKLKIGKGTPAQDVERISVVLEILPAAVKLRLDANQHWTLDQAIEVGKQLPAERIAYIEEPTANAIEFPEFYRVTGVQYALDETVQKPGYQFQFQQGLAALILKPTLVGGIKHCRNLIRSAGLDGVRTVFSSSFESSVGIHVLQQLSAIYTPEELPGLDTVSAFESPLVTTYPLPGKSLTFPLP